MQVLQPTQTLTVIAPDIGFRQQLSLAPTEHPVQVATFAQLHHDVELAILDETLDVRDNVWVIDRGEELHLAQHRRLCRRLELVEALHLLERKPAAVGGAAHGKDGAVGAGTQLAFENEVGAHRHACRRARPSPPPADDTPHAPREVPPAEGLSLPRCPAPPRFLSSSVPSSSY
eukprot:scaffold65440_cov30-Tisochrysis_lutea.AAC.3